MHAKVKWTDGLQFVGQSASGHSIVMDGSGGKSAPSPMEMVLMAAGGCSSVDVIAGLKADEQKVTDCVAELTTERKESAPRVFTTVHVHFTVTGESLDEACVSRVVKDSLEKFCSVCLMLQGTVPMTHSYEIKSA
ncbi:OsmC family protein [Vibrio ulleungensis]|uniref:OsmC family protein n=1 Tax=Vibrio ulleungensis TaxID=2807619 RepID=A0ABS2HD80_9VIBR|nr:OsmC family protein [Vibrio ulleungensis]MBM7035550.1 OsmC family protein [Vibrio ulleungensis]